MRHLEIPVSGNRIVRARLSDTELVRANFLQFHRLCLSDGQIANHRIADEYFNPTSYDRPEHPPELLGALAEAQLAIQTRGVLAHCFEPMDFPERIIAGELIEEPPHGKNMRTVLHEFIIPLPIQKQIQEAHGISSLAGRLLHIPPANLEVDVRSESWEDIVVGLVHPIVAELRKADNVCAFPIMNAGGWHGIDLRPGEDGSYEGTALPMQDGRTHDGSDRHDRDLCVLAPGKALYETYRRDGANGYFGPAVRGTLYGNSEKERRRVYAWIGISTPLPFLEVQGI